VLAGLATIALADGPSMKSASGGKVKQSVMWDGQLYVLKFIDQNKVVDLNEYYLVNETPQNWTRMLSVSIYKSTGNPGAMARNMQQVLLKEHPDAPNDLAAAKDDSEALFMCLNWAGDRKTGSEFDVYRLQKS